MSIEFKLPDLGENIEAGDVVSLLVSEGDDIQAEQNVLELETDKAVVEVPCPHSGRVERIHVKAGDRVSIGDPVLTLAAGGDGGAESAGAVAALESALPSVSPADPVGDTPVGETPAAGEGLPAADLAEESPAVPEGRAEAPPRPAPGLLVDARGRDRPPAPAGPATRRLARELGVDLHGVKGSGPGGRITREDVKAHVKVVLGDEEAAASGPLPAGASARGEIPRLPDFAEWGRVDREPLSGIRRATAEAMSTAWRTVPHVTQFDRADITDLEAARQRHETSRPEGSPKVTVTALAIKAAAAALKAFPRFNSSLDVSSGELIIKRYYHIGVAVDTEHGLIVPVIRDVDQKSVRELAGELNDLAQRARNRKVSLSEMRGGTFTITNLGGIGGTAFTPIVNYPEVAILGMARSRREAVPRDGGVESRLIVPLCLSYDHRVIDGADGARFLSYLARLFEEPFRMILEI